MKATRPSYKLIILITQLLLLGGCSGLFPDSKPATIQPIDVKSLESGEDKCLAALKEGIEKYRDNIAKDFGELGLSPVTWQLIETRGKNWALPVAKQTSECKDVIDKPTVKNLVEKIQLLTDTNSLVIDPKEAKTKDEKIKGKIGSIELSQAENPNNNTIELVPRQFIKYTNDKLQALITSLASIPSPTSLQNKELQKQLADNTAKLTSQNEKIQQLESNQNIMMPVVFLLLPLVGVAGYFLGKGSKSPNLLDNSQSKDRSLDRLSKQDRSPKQDRQKPVVNETSSRKRLGALDSRKSPSNPPISPLANQEIADRDLKFRLNDKKQPPTNDSDRDNTDPIITNQSQRLNSGRYQNPESAFDRASSSRNVDTPKLTYDLATEYYNNKDYDLLKPLSKGYYDATSDSVMRNREFWGNPLELFADSDGLFWIIQTVEPYLLLLPNPSKRIAKTRLPGFEYFFETDFKGENYQSCRVISAAYMDYVSGKWVIAQKGQLNFVY